MEIFKEVAYKLEKLKNPHFQLEVEKSEETDSGRSSDNCIIESLNTKSNRLNSNNNNNNNLKVVREKTNLNPYNDYDKCGTIGYAGIKNLQMKKEPKQIPQLIVRRRNRETIKKRNSRRNTIDVNAFDLEKASKTIQQNDKNYLNTSRSTNYLDKLIADEDDFESKINKMRLSDGFSVPDVNKLKLEDNLNSKISHIFNHKKSEQNLIKYHSEESFLCSPNKGPEFIYKSHCPHRSIKLSKSKNVPAQTIHVILLNGQSLHIKCNYLTTTTKDIFKAVIESEDYHENFYLGLCALIGGDFVFLPSDLKIYKVAPQNWLNATNKKFSGSLCSVFFTLFLRIKFYLPNLKGVSSLQTRHMLYLQLRKNILEKLILCSDDDLIVLGGLALQAEMGDYKKNLEYLDYFRVSHYLPEDVYCRNKEMAKHLRNSHYCRRGMNHKEAEYNFVKYVQEMKEYGFHLFSANWVLSESTFIKIYLGISLGGITFFERNFDQQNITYPTDKLIINQTSNNNNNLIRNTTYKILLKHFEWLEIENLCFSKHILCIVVRKLESLKAKDNNKIKFKLRMDDKKSYFAFSLASEHHQFYLKLRNSYVSSKSIANELNIPIISKENLKYITEKENMKIISLSSLSSSTVSAGSGLQSSTELCKNCDTNTFENCKQIQKGYSSDNKIENPYTIPLQKSSTSIVLSHSATSSLSSSTTSTPPSIKNNVPTLIDEKKIKNLHCPYHSQQHQFQQQQQQQHDTELIASNANTVISKTTKTTTAIKPQKKSMLNDNRLSKLKEKFLRRTKSTAAGLEINLKNKFKKDNNKKQTNSIENLKELNRNENICHCNCKIGIPTTTTSTITTNNKNFLATEEEYQNKKNESPKNYGALYGTINQGAYQQLDTAKDQLKECSNELITSNDILNTSITSSTTTAQGVKICSPNRNKVKMGTRVFSSQFLNKSYDNIYDRFKQFNNKNSTENSSIPPIQLPLPPVPSEPPSSSSSSSIRIPSSSHIPSSLQNTTEDDNSEIDGGIYDTIDYKRDNIKNVCRINSNNGNNTNIISEFNVRQFDLVDVPIERYQNNDNVVGVGDDDDDCNRNDNINISPITMLNQYQQQINTNGDGDGGGGDGGSSTYSGVYCKVNKNYLTNKCTLSQIKSPISFYHHQQQEQQQRQQQEQQQQQNLLEGHNNIRGSSEEAYVIHSSISSDFQNNNNFSINNDTISDSLMERFNNISDISGYGPERLLRKVVVVKEIVDVLPSVSVSAEEQNTNFTFRDSLLSTSCEKQQLQQQQQQKQRPQSPVNQIGSSIVKYSTFSPGKMKTLLRSFSNIDCIRDQNNTNKNNNNGGENMNSSNFGKLKLKNVKSYSEETTTKENLYQEINSCSFNVTETNDNLQNYTLGISIVQGSNDNNVYVKDLIKNGPGDKSGIIIGDQIIAVNGISLLNLSYMESLKLLQNTGRIVDLVISQINTTGILPSTATATTVIGTATATAKTIEQTTKDNSKNNNNNSKNKLKDNDCLQQSENINYSKNKLLQQQQQQQQHQKQNSSIDDGHHENYKKATTKIDTKNKNFEFKEYNRQAKLNSKNNICSKSATTTTTNTIENNIDSSSGTIKMSTGNQNKDINQKIKYDGPSDDHRNIDDDNDNDDNDDTNDKRNKIQKNKKNKKFKKKEIDKEENYIDVDEDENEMKDIMIDGNITLSMSNVCVTNVEHLRENYLIRKRIGVSKRDDDNIDGIINKKLVSSSDTDNLIENKNTVSNISCITTKNNLDPNISRSLPDLPKVISVLSNKTPLFGETVEYATVLRKSQRRTAANNHTRKYVGPMRYPVTPKKLYITSATTNKHNNQNQLSIKEHTQQVLI